MADYARWQPGSADLRVGHKASSESGVQSASNITTILFTDIEGSTRLWEQHSDKMSRALAAHDAVARAAVTQHSGVVVKMIGDGMYAAFTDPLDAVKTTVALQRSLAEIESTHEILLK